MRLAIAASAGAQDSIDPQAEYPRINHPNPETRHSSKNPQLTYHRTPKCFLWDASPAANEAPLFQKCDLRKISYLGWATRKHATRAIPALIFGLPGSIISLTLIDAE
jgi:hypothetical protein